MQRFSPWLRNRPEMRIRDAEDRVRLAMARLPNVLEREIVACQKTLEQKISDAGPAHQRVDPHLLSLAIHELAEERRILTSHTHENTKTVRWYSNARTPKDQIDQKLAELAPLYAEITGNGFGNFTGDALEIITFKSIQALQSLNQRYSFDGSFDLTGLNAKGRYQKTEPSQTISGQSTTKRPDFIIHGFDSGPVCVECKNYREWLYPHHGTVTETIKKAIDLDITPLLVARKIHYTTKTNLLESAGIIAHESYYQYFMPQHAEIADKAKHVRSLGFSDVRSTLDPDRRTLKFFTENLLKIVDRQATRFRENKNALEDYVNNELNLAQLYNAIGSPAAGNWYERDENSGIDVPF